MKKLLIAGLLVAASCASAAHTARAQSPATLYFTQTAAGKKPDYSRVFLSFRTGEVGGNELGDKIDLAFGLVKISNADWFQIKNGNDGRGRSVMRDLGEHAWSGEIVVPALAPLPELKPGELRTVTIDSSGNTHQEWARTTPLFAKVQVGHVYAVRVVREGVDLYALFRVEAHEQDKMCAIIWQIVPAPAPDAAGPGR